MNEVQEKLDRKIRTIQDFPVEGVLFRDITTLLKDAEGLHDAVDQMQHLIGEKKFDLVVGPESRGFIFGMPLAYNLRKGFVLIRKQGKLPAAVYSREYALEYGTAAIEIHQDAVQRGQKVIIVDDLLATGGTAKAMVDLLEDAGAEVVGLYFLIELKDLGGRNKLDGYPVYSVLQY